MDEVMRESTEVHAPEKDVNDAGPKVSEVVQDPGKVPQEEILEA